MKLFNRKKKHRLFSHERTESDRKKRILKEVALAALVLVIVVALVVLLMSIVCVPGLRESCLAFFSDGKSIIVLGAIWVLAVVIGYTIV